MSRSASSSTMSVFLPPNSEDTFLRWRPASSPTFRPADVEPVNAIIATFGSLHKAAPASPAPGRTCSTPSGRPASASSCAMTTDGGAWVWLNDDSIANGQRRRDRPHREVERKVERGNDPDDPERHTPTQTDAIIAAGQH